MLFEVGSERWNGRMEGCRTERRVVLCGVTDGDGERQTELSERGEEGILLLQTPALHPGAGTPASGTIAVTR